MEEHQTILDIDKKELFLTVEELAKRIEKLENIIGSFLSKLEHIPSLTIENTLPCNQGEVDPLLTLDEARSFITRSHLDFYCNPTIEDTPEPSVSEIAKITLQIGTLYKHLDSKQITSQIRRWFRKRREEMGIRIIHSFRKKFKRDLSDDQSFKKIRDLLEIPDGKDGHISISCILNECDLEVKNRKNADLFARSKICSFIDRARNT